MNRLKESDHIEFATGLTQAHEFLIDLNCRIGKTSRAAAIARQAITRIEGLRCELDEIFHREVEYMPERGPGFPYYVKPKPEGGQE